MDQDLIPGLPEELARECLIRVPYHSFGHTRSVCRRWQTEIESPLFHRIRNLSNLTRLVIAFTQAQSPLSSSGPAHKYHTPSYRLTTYDPSTATWRSLPPIPGVPGGLPLFCQLAAADRKIVVIGGWDPETWAPSDGVHVYDFATAEWSRGASMPGPRRSFFACAAGPGRVVYVAGGHDEEKNAMRSAMMYDVDGDEWAPLPDMATERDECKGVFLGEKFHVVGGYSTDAQGRFTTSAEVFDVGAWGWSPVEEGRLDAATCPRTCVAGDDGRMWMCRRGQVAVLDGDTWRAVGEVPEGASVVTAVMRWQGRVMVMGSGNHGGAQEGYVMMEEDVGISGNGNGNGNGKGKGKLTWQRVEVPAEYSGHIQASCCLEI